MAVPAWCRLAWHGLLDLFLPPCCPLCTRLLPPETPGGFCADCLARFHPMPDAACRRCAHPYPSGTADDHLCATCLAETAPLFERVVAGGLFAGPLQEAIHRFKYRNRIDLDRPLATLLLSQPALAETRADLIVPVPLHAKRLRHRLYNQSLLIARQLSRNLATPCDPQLLLRSRDTRPQQGLAAEARRQNLRGAFRASRQLAGLHVLLVDDVLTTGATARECCRVLKQAGAGSITVAVLARAQAF